MKKIISAFFVFSSIVFASTIELTGKYSQELGNPYRVLLEKKNKSIEIYSESKSVKLKVESNLDSNSIYNLQLQHPKEYVFNNKTIENVLKNYYGEEFNIVNKKGNIELNVLSGRVILTYLDNENSQINHINKVEVELTVELIKNDKKIQKTILMDDTLGITGDNYNWTIRKTFDFSIKSLNSTIEEIIEHILYRKILKDN